MTLGDLVAFAQAHSWQALADVRDTGLESGYPQCCTEFYARLIPYMWWWPQFLMDGRNDHPEVEAYWRLVVTQPEKVGYIPCPPCLGLPLTTGLDPTPVIAERAAWQRDMAELEAQSAAERRMAPPVRRRERTRAGQRACRARHRRQLSLFESSLTLEED
jgi:hypothetical protein